jgi:hypothetical protein
MKTFKLDIRATIRAVELEGQYERHTGEQLTIEESLLLPNVLSFTEAAAIIGRFHELGEKIKAARESAGG